MGSLNHHPSEVHKSDSFRCSYHTFICESATNAYEWDHDVLLTPGVYFEHVCVV